MISIIIPTYNEEKVIGGLLSRLKQLTLPHQVIVSDAGSKDQTVAIAKQSADKVTVYPGVHPPTIATGRNDGAKLATGDFVAFIDADCIMQDPDAFFTTALQQFERDKQLTGLCAAIWVLPELATFADRFWCGVMNLFYYTMNNILRIGAATGEFQMMRRETFLRLHGFRQDLATSEDMNMFYRLARIGRTKLCFGLRVYNTGRRQHKYGWTKVVLSWLTNTFSMAFRSKSPDKEWEVIR